MVFAVALLSAVAAAPAGATTICEDSPCLHPSANHSVFEGTGELSMSSVICSTTSFDFEITGAGGGATQLAEISNFLLSGCTGGCTVSAVHQPWKAQVTVFNTGPDGFAKLTSSGAGNPGLKSNCTGTGLICEYTATTITVAIFGGSIAIFKTSGQPLALVSGGSSPGCGSTAAINAVHEVSPLKGSGGFWVRT